MKQIDQDPGEYRVQRPDGSWTQRVDKRFCRGMAVLGAFLSLLFIGQFATSGGDIRDAVLFLFCGIATGLLAGLSVRATP